MRCQFNAEYANAEAEKINTDVNQDQFKSNKEENTKNLPGYQNGDADYGHWTAGNSIPSSLPHQRAVENARLSGTNGLKQNLPLLRHRRPSTTRQPNVDHGRDQNGPGSDGRHMITSVAVGIFRRVTRY